MGFNIGNIDCRITKKLDVRQSRSNMESEDSNIQRDDFYK